MADPRKPSKRGRTFAWYTKHEPVFKGGMWVKGQPVTALVRVMTAAEGYAMVRYTGCAPFVVREREIEVCERSAQRRPKP